MDDTKDKKMDRMADKRDKKTTLDSQPKNWRIRDRQ